MNDIALTEAIAPHTTEDDAVAAKLLEGELAAADLSDQRSHSLGGAATLA